MSPPIDVKSAYKIISGDFGENGKTIVLAGNIGSGKSLLAKIVGAELEDKGWRVFHTKAFQDNQSIGYKLYTEILGQWGKEVEKEQPEEILSGFEELIQSSYPQSTAIIMENLDRFGDQNRDLFLKLSEKTFRGNILIIGTVTYDASSRSNYDFFISLLRDAKNVTVIELGGLDKEDVGFLSRKRGYKVTADFVNDVYEMCSGNIWLIEHAFEYFTSLGIINSSKELNQAVYRFLPVPPTVDDYYNSVIKALPENGLLILDIMVLDSGSTGVVTLKVLLPETEYHTSDLILDLERKGLIRLAGSTVSFASVSFYRHYMGLDRPEVNDQVFMNAKNNPDFDELPLHIRLISFVVNGDHEIAAAIINEQGISLIRSLNSDDQLQRLKNLVQKKMPDSGLLNDLELVHGAHLYYLGYAAKAASTLENIRIDGPQSIQHRILLGLIYNLQGRYDQSETMARSVLEDPGISSRNHSDATAIMSEVCLNTGKPEESMKLAQELFEESMKNEYYDLVGKALTLLGNNYLIIGEMEKGLESYNKSIEVSKEHGLKTQLMYNLVNRGFIHDTRGQYDLEISDYLETIRISYSIGDVAVRSFAISSLSEVYYMLGMIEEANSFLGIQEEILEVTGNRGMKYELYRSTVRNMLLDIDLEGIDKFIELACKFSSPDEEEQVLIMNGMGATAELFRKIKGLPDGLTAYLFDYSPGDTFLPYFHFLGSVSYLLVGDVPNAIRCLDKLIETDELNADDFYRAWVKAAKMVKHTLTGETEIVENLSTKGGSEPSRVPFANFLAQSAGQILSFSTSGDMAQLIILKLNPDFSDTVPKLLASLVKCVQAHLMYLKFHVDPAELRAKLDVDDDSTGIPSLLYDLINGQGSLHNE